MEVRLEAIEEDLPQDTYVSLRIGAVQKQSRLAASRTFHFPEQKEAKHAEFGRIEIYKKIGACIVPLAGAAQAPREMQIALTDCDLASVGVRLEIASDGAAAATERSRDKARRKKERLDEAQRYISEHNLEELLANSLRDVMRDQPVDPASFLSGQILTKKEKARPAADAPEQPPAPQETPGPQEAAPQPPQSAVPATAPSPQPPQPPAPEPVTNPQLGTHAPDVGQAPDTAPDATAVSVSPEAAPKAFGLRPSVGTWLSPRPKATPEAAPEAAECASVAGAEKAFGLRPSVGTWLSPRPQATPEAAAEATPEAAECASAAGSEKAFALRPSVGTWLLPRAQAPPAEAQASPAEPHAPPAASPAPPAGPQAPPAQALADAAPSAKQAAAPPVGSSSRSMTQPVCPDFRRLPHDGWVKLYMRFDWPPIDMDQPRTPPAVCVPPPMPCLEEEDEENEDRAASPPKADEPADAPQLAQVDDGPLSSNVFLRGEAAQTGQAELASMRSTQVLQVLQSSRNTATYVQDLQEVIRAKEAKLRALAAQLQALTGMVQ